MEQIKRRRGGQPANQNARKHGFYSTVFTKLEVEDLALLGEGLNDEILMLRVMIRRLIAASDGAEMMDLIEILQGLSLAASSVAGLMKAQTLIQGNKGGNNTFEEELTLALKEVWKDMKRP